MDFEFDDSNAITLSEFIDKWGNQYAWETTLYEEILDWEWEHNCLEEDLEGDQTREYNEGDVVFVPNPISERNPNGVGPHRVVVIYKKKIDKDKETGKDIIKYSGYLLSSKIKNSNKYRPQFSNCIYIDNYSTIMKNGPKPTIPALVNVREVVTFTNKDFSASGTWKGHVTDEFMDFVKNCRSNFEKGISNRKVYWEK